MNLLSGPREMYEVRNMKDVNLMMELYSKEYEGIFGIKPILESAHTIIFSDIVKSCPTLDKAQDLLLHFLSMKDEWFQKGNYSPETLKKNLSLVATDLKRRITPVRQQNQKPQIVTKITCDDCFRYFDLTCDLHFLYSDKPRRCASCTDARNTVQHA